MTLSTDSDTLISDTATLARFCAGQQGAEFVTVDTEFMRERTFWPILCVVQVAGPNSAVAIDALAPELDLKPLLALMADPTILKVFHAARQDLEIFFQLSGQVPHPIFDTQIAAMVCGFGDAASFFAGALPPGDADATGASPLTRSCPTSRRGQAESSARPAGADKGSPLTKTRAASGSLATGRDPGPPSN